MKPVLARQMEVYAGFLEHTDHHVGRLIDALKDLGVLEDTLIYLIIGDNGASAEGSLQGCFNEMAPLTGFPHLETAKFLTERLDKLGGPEAYNHYAVGWAHAMCAPYQWTKQVASHFGGTRNGTIVHWPKGIKAKGEIRSQFHHVIDVAPTILEAAGLPEPVFVNGVQQRPIEGVSMLYAFNDADGGRAARDAVFRDGGQSRNLPQGLDRGDPAPDAVGDRAGQAPRLRRRQLGAVRHHDGLDPGEEPGQGASGQAARAAAAMADRGGQVQRAAARRPVCRACQPRPRRPAAIDQRATARSCSAAWDG